MLKSFDKTTDPVKVTDSGPAIPIAEYYANKLKAGKLQLEELYGWLQGGPRGYRSLSQRHSRVLLVTVSIYLSLLYSPISKLRV
jgi:hypothetical protein